jgi:hypothetical protein
MTPDIPHIDTPSPVTDVPLIESRPDADGAAVRLLYGDLADPVLELEPMQVSEVLSRSSG